MTIRRGYIPRNMTQAEIEKAFIAVYKAFAVLLPSDLPDMTLAKLNELITDATLDDHNDPRTPKAHETTHEPGGTDDLLGKLVVGDGVGTLLNNDNHSLLLWNI